MAKRDPYRVSRPRSAELEVLRFADKRLFVRDLTPELDKYFAATGPIPCEGGGKIGTHCEQCRFGAVNNLSE